MRREFWHQRIFAVYSFLQFRLSTIASSYSVNSIHSALSVGCKLKMPGQCQVRLVLMFFCLVYVVYHPFIHFVCCQQWRAIHSALSRMQAENELLWCARCLCLKMISLSCLFYVQFMLSTIANISEQYSLFNSRMQAENELSWCARWGALCTISGLGGHRTPSAAEAHCSINAHMYKSTMRTLHKTQNYNALHTVFNAQVYRSTMRMKITQNTINLSALHTVHCTNVHKQIDAHYTILNCNNLLCHASLYCPLVL